MAVHPLETYLKAMQEISSTGGGRPETSCYSALENLLNEIGGRLKPEVRCVMQLADRGAGSPDGGLFTASQFRKQSPDAPPPGQVPERGVIEVKPPGEDAWVAAEGAQVSRYWGRYGAVLVTNYRDFVLLGKDERGRPAKLETYRLAADERAFRELLHHPQWAVQQHGQRLTEYLQRVMLQAAPLTTSEDVAWFLASYAREAKARIERSDLPALTAVREALEEALGLTFEGERGDHFFRSTLVQTLFYGVFSAWVLWCKENPQSDGRSGARFAWRQAAWSLRVPMIRALFEQVASPTKLEPLGLVEPLTWAAEALNRVDRAAFFAGFDQGEAVQYFYEPFLEQFDPELRRELGVWYTPTEIVRYMVARVDTVLREELDIADGLADPRVFVLDPCCGTGAYLVEVLRKIGEIHQENQGRDGLTALEVKKAAMDRVFGFEILPAPFVIAHLQIGLMLTALHAPLDEKRGERVGVYLTNALTGWSPPKGPKQHLMFAELEEERDAAERVKCETPILVILGNPPYNAFAGVSPKQEAGLVDPYKEGLNRPVSEGGWGIKKFNLDDLYVRFFRVAERRIAEFTGKGVVCFISNYSYLDDPSFVVMRERFLREFDSLWFDCLNGDSRETGKLTPDGKPDPSVFSAPGHPVGIRVGTTIGLAVRKSERDKSPRVRYRDFWGKNKRAELLASLKAKRNAPKYTRASPERRNRYAFRPAKVAARYLLWPRLVDLCAVQPSNGLMEKRGGALIDIDRSHLERHMRAYFNRKLDWEEYKALGYGLTKPQASFDPKKARKGALATEQFDAQRIVRYAVRPFDVRSCYYTPVGPIWNRPRPTLWAQCWPGNRFFMSRPGGVASPEGAPMFFTRLLGDNDFLRGHAYYFPVHVRNGQRLDKRGQLGLFEAIGEEREGDEPVANLSSRARAYLKWLGIKNPDADAKAADTIWMHALAIGYAPAYLAENADGVRQDWPRIPLPDTRKRLTASAELGRRVAELLDTESTIRGVDSGTIRHELRPVAALHRADGLALSLRVTAGWGRGGKEGVIMPGKGRLVERDYTRDETDAMRRGAAELHTTLDSVLTQWGATTFDVYLNDTTCWSGVPANVWNFIIGGYPVIKKWLSYREHDVLGRDLTPEEAREVMSIARRIAALLLLGPHLDENYVAARDASCEWREKE